MRNKHKEMDEIRAPMVNNFIYWPTVEWFPTVVGVGELSVEISRGFYRYGSRVFT